MPHKIWHSAGQIPFIVFILFLGNGNVVTQIYFYFGLCQSLCSYFYILDYSHIFVIGPSGVRAVPLGCRHKRIGPSGVCQLPLGCRHKRSGHSTWHYFSFFFFSLSESLTFLPERRQLGFQNFAWAPKSQKY